MMTSQFESSLLRPEACHRCSIVELSQGRHGGTKLDERRLIGLSCLSDSNTYLTV